MIEKGKMTVIDHITYVCLRVEEGKAHLQDITNPKGRPNIMQAEYVPFFNDDGEFIIPEKPELKKGRIPTVIKVRDIFKEEADLPYSNDAIRFMVEWAETAIANMINWSQNNAESMGHSKITAAHIYWWQLHANQSTLGYWKNQKEHSSRDIYE